MNNLLYKSILELTSQRDTDSLHESFMMSLCRHIELNAAELYKVSGDLYLEGVEQVFQMDNMRHDGGPDLRYTHIPVELNEWLDKCIRDAECVEHKLDQDRATLYIPVNVHETVQYVVAINAARLANEEVSELVSLAAIYGKLLFTLDRSERDKLTGLYNRSTFDAKLNQLLSLQKHSKYKYFSQHISDEQRAFESDASAWLVLLDVDFFKRVNDEYGHVAGDEVLLRLSQKMRQNFRHTDLLFRFGGEEFIIVLEPVSFEMAEAALERFRKSIAGHQFPLVGCITVSIGFSRISEADFPAAALGCADKALYYIKEHGRNGVANYEQLLQAGLLEEKTVTGSIDLF